MKGKDPAFLFYSTDFYEGTRTMLPEERACFLDLMIYQHQRGYIPNDIKRVLLYCNGIDEATLKATLEAKFKLTDKGWINERLQMVIEEREAYSEKQSINGIVGQFWKKAKAILNKKDFDTLKDSLSNQSNNDILELIKDKEINKATLEAMLEALLKHLEDRDRNRIKDIDLEEGGTGETKPKKDADMDIINKLEVEPLLIQVVYDWLKYKRTRGESYKSDKSVSLFIANLTKYSGGDISKARQIIEQSMANNWAGIFELKKPVSFGTPKPEMEVNSKWGRKSNIK